MISRSKLKKSFWLCIVLVVLISCTPMQASEEVQPSMKPSSTEITITEQATTTPKPPTITPLPTRSTPTVYPPENPGEEWLTYAHPNLDISIQYPPDWQVINPEELGGVDGSLTFSSRSFDGEGPDAVCQLEANRHELYGAQPLINLWNNNNSFYGCEIQPSDDSPNSKNGVILAWYPSVIPSGEILEIHVSIDFIKAIENSIKSTVRIPKQVMYVNQLPQECLLNGGPPDVTSTGGLQFEEYRLTSDECYRRMDVETFAALLPQQASEHLAELRRQSVDSIAGINAELTPFDFSIQDAILYKGQMPVSGQLDWVGQPAVNASQTLLYLPVNESSNYKTYMISKTSFEITPNDRFYSILGYVPTRAFLGDDFIQLAYDPDYRSGVGSPFGLQVLKNGDVIFEYTVLPSSPASSPVRGLYTWQDHWLLETGDVFIQDGEVLNQQLGYSEMFTWRLLDNKPFYFFRQGSQIHLSYNEETLPNTFERILHEPSCCSGAMVNMTLADEGLGFYALRDGFWYYVILSAIP